MATKLEQKQKELIKLLDDNLDCMVELKDAKLRQEIAELEKQAEEQECDHPYALVRTRCFGEINYCLKCGKNLD
jgi:hypothetical protein